MTEIRGLLEVLDRVKAQHRAGITPTFGQIEELFDCAARAREELVALENGMAPPSRCAAPVSPVPTSFEQAAPVLARVEGKASVARITVELSPGARAVVESAAA
ncbi:MAG TPA: hypothetical protein VM364_07925 [Vicinamibacterales bacterium]|nr:hypothetical protein [Vicinamibacterales bacterium]